MYRLSFSITLRKVCSNKQSRLVQRDEFEVERELRVWWDARELLVSVGVVCWNDDASLSTDTHALDTNVPTLDDIALAELELERFTFGVC